MFWSYFLYVWSFYISLKKKGSYFSRQDKNPKRLSEWNPDFEISIPKSVKVVVKVVVVAKEKKERREKRRVVTVFFYWCACDKRAVVFLSSSRERRLIKRSRVRDRNPIVYSLKKSRNTTTHHDGSCAAKSRGPGRPGRRRRRRRRRPEKTASDRRVYATDAPTQRAGRARSKSSNQLKEAKKQFDKTEGDLTALQSMGQIIGEVLRQLDEDRFIVKASSGPRYIVGCRSKLDREKLVNGTRVALDMTTLTIMRALRERWTR